MKREAINCKANLLSNMVVYYTEHLKISVTIKFYAEQLKNRKRAGNTRLIFLRFQEQSNEHFIFTVLFKRKIPRSGKTEIGVFQILF